MASPSMLVGAAPIELNVRYISLSVCLGCVPFDGRLLSFSFYHRNFVIKWLHRRESPRRKLCGIDGASAANKNEGLEKVPKNFCVDAHDKQNEVNYDAGKRSRLNGMCAACPYSAHRHTHNRPSTSVSAPNRIKHSILCEANNTKLE